MTEILLQALTKIANNDIDIPADVYAQHILEEIKNVKQRNKMALCHVEDVRWKACNKVLPRNRS